MDLHLLLRRFAALVWILLLAVAACSPSGSNPLEPVPSTPTVSSSDGWSAFFLRTPYPYGTPLPLAEYSPLDGTYVKMDPITATPFPCRRCPDYKPEGGLWKLNFDNGIFRIYHTLTGWKSMGSFRVDGKKLYLFNDPNCTNVTGTYTWQVIKGELLLMEVEDSCAIRLRAVNLTKQPWRSCQPPNQEAGRTGHWPEPEGCTAKP